MKKITGIIIGIFALLVLSLAISLGQSEFAVIGQTQVSVGEDGNPVWVITLAPTGPNEKLVFIEADDMEPGEEDGGLYIPQSDFSITFNPIENYCEYSLTYDQTFSDKISSFFSDIFGEGYTVYRLGFVPENNVMVLVSPSKGDEQLINFANQNEPFTFNDKTDGKGTIRMSTLGTFGGLVDCPSAGDIAVRYFDDGTYDFVGLEDAQQNIGSRGEIDYFGSAFSRINPDISNRVLRAYQDDSAIGVVTITADAEYFDVKYIPPSTGKPQIIDTTSPGEVLDGGSAGTSIIIKNVGVGDGRFKITATNDNGYISPTSKSVDIEQGDTEVVFFNVIAGDIDNGEEAKITYKVCSVNLFTDNFCVTESTFFTITERTLIPPKTDCGNGVCEPDKGENSQTCNTDCPWETQCDLEHESLYKSSCECDPGYEYKEDVTGREYCGAIDELGEWVTIISIALMFTVLIGGMVIVYVNKKK